MLEILNKKIMKLQDFTKFKIQNAIYIYGGGSGSEDPTEGEEEQNSPQSPPPGIPSNPLKPKKE